MSKETSWWLNNMTLIGFSLKRGNAWHYRFEDQGNESNHYPDAIPVPDVLRRLFDFDINETPLYVQDEHGMFQEVPGRKAMRTSDNGDILGIFKAGYQGHDYKTWLLDNVANLLDDDLGIGSAGLLRNRGQAWVSVEVPESIDTPEGVTFRPNLIACTSFDGTLATTYKRVVQVVVCDNTLAAGLEEDGQVFKVKHSKYSAMKIRDAKDALAIVHTMGADFADEVSRLTAWKVTDEQFKKLLNGAVPVPEVKGRGQTMAENKQAEIIQLYRSDERAAPWQGTAFGVLQAFNTWNHHKSIIRASNGEDTTRVIRNMENVVTDRMQAKDQEILDLLAQVCA